MIFRRFAAVCLAVLLLAVLGCREDEITRYTVPRQETPDPSVRFLGVIVPHAERTWFFKLVGPVSVVEEQRAKFDQFLSSVRFTDKPDTPVTWDTPEGWQQEGKSKLRYATLRYGPKGRGVELSVTPLGREAGSVLDNVNRWRGQLSLPSINDEQLAKLTTPLKVGGENAVLVDMIANPAKATVPAPVAGGAAKLPLTYRLPEGWTEQPPKPFRLVGFLVTEGGQSAETTISTAGGNLLDNINRWRGQIQLPPIDDRELTRQVRELEVDGVKSSYVELTGPESAGAKRESILGVIVVRGGQNWFIKMKGPADLVAKQKSKFEEFVRSVRFE